MKKLLIISASILLAFANVNAVEKRIGIAAGYTNVEADGTETLKDSSKKASKSVDDNTVIPSIFFELAADNGFGLGIEHVPGSADIGTQSRTDDDEETAGNNKASAEIDGLTSLYAIKTFDNGLFLKAGMTQTDVITKETLATGSTYGNKSVDGKLIGIGIHKTRDNGVFFRASAEYTDYDSFKLTSGVADAVTGTTNTIDADVDTTAFKISIGKAF
tara:strand:- start:424 stop:1074 length:651 start_codon:yes stop_codon:yes gene_type:complete